MLQSSAERYKHQRQGRIKWWDVKGSMRIGNEKGKEIKYPERTPDKGTLMLQHLKLKWRKSQKMCNGGWSPCPLESQESTVLPLLSLGLAHIPLGVTWEQWMYEYVWDDFSLWAVVTGLFPSYNFKFPLVSICSEWRIWVLISGQFFPWLSERFNTWWYRETRHTQRFSSPCKISSLISHTYSHLPSLYRSAPLCSVPAASNPEQISLMPCPSQHKILLQGFSHLRIV